MRRPPSGWISCPSLTLSAASYLELLQGMRNKAELAAVQKMLQRRSATLLPVTEMITQQAIALMESLTLSHGLQMGDALIAATALAHQLPLLTGNVKHFAVVPGLLIEGFFLDTAHLISCRYADRKETDDYFLSL